MKVRMRYDERDGAFETLAPRVELVYKPEQTSSVSAIFDQTTSSPLTQPQAVSAWASPKTESDRIRNYELAYAKALGDTRGRVSYAWQETADGFAHIGNDSFGQHVGKLSLDVPILPKRLTTSFELQYIDVFGPLAGDRRSDFVIGNLTLASAALTGDTHVTVGMHNVFGAQASGSGSQWPAAVPTDGRSVRLDFTRKL
jgi:hypothetical protein